MHRIDVGLTQVLPGELLSAVVAVERDAAAVSRSIVMLQFVKTIALYYIT